MAVKQTDNMSFNYLDATSTEKFNVQTLLNDNWQKIDAIDPENRLNALEKDVSDAKTSISDYATVSTTATTALTTAKSASTAAATNKKSISSLKTSKQDVLTAGTGIAISADNVISGAYTQGTGIVISDGKISLDGSVSTSLKAYSDKKLTGTQSKLTAGTGIELDDTTSTISVSDSGVTAGSYGLSANATPVAKGKFNVPYITVDSTGRITSAANKTVTLPDDNDTNTKNTAGSTEDADSLYLIGAKEQSANPQTYSNKKVYEKAGGLYSDSFSASDSITAGNNISAKNGYVNAGTTITAGTGITSTTGNITATKGDIVAKAGKFTGDGSGLTNVNAATVAGKTIGVASASTLGLVKIGSGLSITTDGVLSSSGNSYSGSTDGFLTEAQLNTILADYAQKSSLDAYTLKTDTVSFATTTDVENAKTAMNTELTNTINAKLADYAKTSALSGYAKTTDLENYAKTEAINDIVADWYNANIINSTTGITQIDAFKWNGNSTEVVGTIPYWKNNDDSTLIGYSMTFGTHCRLISESLFNELNGIEDFEGYSSATDYYNSKANTSNGYGEAYTFTDSDGDTKTRYKDYTIDLTKRTYTTADSSASVLATSTGTIINFGTKKPVFAILTEFNSDGENAQEFYATCDWDMIETNVGAYLSSWTNADGVKNYYKWEKTTVDGVTNYSIRIIGIKEAHSANYKLESSSGYVSHSTAYWHYYENDERAARSIKNTAEYVKEYSGSVVHDNDWVKNNDYSNLSFDLDALFAVSVVPTTVTGTSTEDNTSAKILYPAFNESGKSYKCMFFYAKTPQNVVSATF